MSTLTGTGTVKDLLAKKCFHMAGDNRPMAGVNAEQHVGDYLITPDMQHAYKIVAPKVAKKLEGPERDTVIAKALKIYNEMLQSAIARDVARGRLKASAPKPETVEENIRRLQKERVEGKHKRDINPDNPESYKEESIH